MPRVFPTPVSLSLIVCAALPCTVPAQTTTLPKGYASVEGKRSRHVPLRFLPARIQCGYGPKATGWTTTRLVRSLTARVDSSAYLLRAFTCEMQVWLSSQGCKPEVLDPRFASNHGRDVITFMKKKAYRFGTFARGNAPAPFAIELKGDRPFVWRSASLLVDWATYSSTTLSNSNLYVDATNLTATQSGTRGSVRHYGAACNPDNFFVFTSGHNVGEALRTQSFTRNAGDLVINWMAASSTKLALGRACFLHAAPTIVHLQPVSTRAANAAADFYWGVVPSSLGRQKLYTQSAAFDARGASRFSNGVEITFGDFKRTYPFLVAHRYDYAINSTRFDPDRDPARYGWQGTGIIFEVK